jgi:aminoglycoside phosphotransferase (APT) family kinase protein
VVLASVSSVCHESSKLRTFEIQKMYSFETDKPTSVRTGEELDKEALSSFLNLTIEEIAQFPGGYSNLTYCLKTSTGEFVLRKPPHGAKDIKGGHDMGREFRVLSMLKAAGYQKIPNPIVFTDDESIIGTPFYVMERVQGVILRAKDIPNLKDFSAEKMREISIALVDNLVDFHAIDIKQTGLDQIGKPEGYIKRQVEGWIARYEASKTDELEDMQNLGQWLHQNMPTDAAPAMIHNDYKYDNVVFNEDLSSIKAVLDWEMTTVGDPLMDLGAMLSYWSEKNDGQFAKTFNLTWLAGNLNRQEVVERYAFKSGRDVSNIVFFYAFGTFKNAVIVQQIYARYKRGLTQDPRFKDLIHGVKSFAASGMKAIETNGI